MPSALMHFLADRDIQVIAAAVEALSEAVSSGPQAAARLLGELGPSAQSALPALEKQLNNESTFLRLAAAQDCSTHSKTRSAFSAQELIFVSPFRGAPA